jgi:hypothetical protein
VRDAPAAKGEARPHCSELCSIVENEITQTEELCRSAGPGPLSTDLWLEPQPSCVAAAVAQGCLGVAQCADLRRWVPGTPRGDTRTP